MRHTCLFLLLTAPAAGIICPAAATAHDNPFLIRPQQAPVIAPEGGIERPAQDADEHAVDIDAVRPGEPSGARANAASDDADAAGLSNSGGLSELILNQPPRGGVPSLLGASIFGSNRLAQVVDGELFIPPLIAPTTEQGEIGNSELPADPGSETLRESQPLPEGPDRGNQWALTEYLWHAPNTFSNHLYFEDVMLERHGHERWGHLQPLASGARFFATIPMIPYLRVVHAPDDCYYHMGYYRVGSCAPPLLQRPPYERRAAILGGGLSIGAAIAGP